MLRNVLYLSLSVIVFFGVVILYGIILNINQIPLNQILVEKGITNVDSAWILIDRKNHKLKLFDGEQLLKEYKSVFGRNPSIFKKSGNDNATPHGVYSICDIDTNSVYYKYFKINYPSIKDAAEALKNNLINKEEFELIKKTSQSNSCSFDKTVLGGDIGIHGMGEFDVVFRNLPFVFNWTNGSAALSNDDIDEIAKFLKIGTKVKIIN